MYHFNICLQGLKKAQKLRIGGLWDDIGTQQLINTKYKCQLTIIYGSTFKKQIPLSKCEFHHRIDPTQAE